MADFTQVRIKEFIEKLGADYLNGIEKADMSELATILENGSLFRSFMCQVIDEITVDERGQFRSPGFEAVIAHACSEPHRLSKVALELVKNANITDIEKADIATSLATLKDSTKSALLTLSKSRFWARYPSGPGMGSNASVPVLSAWLTDKGESVGKPTHRNMAKDEAIFIEKSYMATVDPKHSGDMSEGVLVLPRGDYRRDESVNENTRQEFILGIASILLAFIVGKPHNSLEEDARSQPAPTVPTALGLSDNQLDFLHGLMSPFAEIIRASDAVVKSLAYANVIPGWTNFELYEPCQPIVFNRTLVTADDNPDAAFEIGAFS